MTRVAIIGAGNVATHLAIALSGKVAISQIYSRNRCNAELLVSRIGVDIPVTDSISDVDPSADVYIVSVKDDAVRSLVEQLPENGRALWVHTSGSAPMDVFKCRMTRYGVLYPLQTFSKDVDVDVREVPFFIEGCNPEVESEIATIARLLSPEVKVADSRQRKRIHAAAVFACNFTNHLWAIAGKLLEDGGYGFDVLMPLLRVTLDKAEKVSPAAGQTGPARRGDCGTMQGHMELLDEDSAGIYRMLSRSIMRQYEISGDI